MPSLQRSLRLALALASAVALGHACSGSDSAIHSPLGPGGPIGTVGADAATADGGADGGDGGIDGGTDAGLDAGTDGGCAGALGLPVSVALDRCSTIAQPQSALLFDSACAAVLYLSQVQRCSGRLSGSLDAFTGVCGQAALDCTSPSLPGRITCHNGTAAGCFIDVCASASDPACQ